MSLVQWFMEPLRKYADFSGRARRKEYWTFGIGWGIISNILNLIYRATGGNIAIGLISGLISLAILVPSIAVGVRRLHDMGRSGKSYLFVLIPLVGWILIFIWTLQDSQPGTNQYGPNPKA